MSLEDNGHAKDSRPPRKKQAYSRNGCVACKRRKVKCDEAIPTCTRCLKANKECIYYRVFKFQNSMTTLVNPTAPIVNQTVKTINNNNSSSTSQYLVENNSYNQQIKSISNPQHNFKLSPSILEKLKIPPSLPAQDMNRVESEAISLSESNEFQIDSLTDLLADQELFVGDMVRLNESFDNELEESIKIVEFNMNNTGYHYNFNTSPGIRYSNVSMNKDYEYGYTLKKSLSDNQLNEIANSLSLSSFDKVYLKSFITNVQCILFPLTNSYLNSPFINSFLSEAYKDSSLLNAMLASGARYLCEKALIDRDNTKDQDKKENLMSTYKHNNAFRVHYLAKCFDNLQDILENLDMTQNSQSALLTSLLLTSDLSSNRDDRWVAHLNGAKHFINKYFKDTHHELSCSLMFSKYLLSSLELSSGLWHLNSTISTLDEFQQMCPIPLNHGPTNLLTKYGLATNSYLEDESNVKLGGYKTFFGYSDETLELLKEISIYQRYSESDPYKLAHLIELVSIAKRVHIISNKPNFQIERDSKYHPYYEGEDKSKMLTSSYFHMTSLEMRKYMQSQDEKDSWYSFFDYLQTVRVSSAYAFILISKKGMNLQPDNKAVQDLINSFIEGSFFYVQLKYLQITDDDLSYFEDYYCSDIIIENENDIERLHGDFFVLKESKLNDLIKSQEPLDHDDYVNFELDHRLCMFQWTLFVFTFSAVTATHRLILDCLLTKLITVGVKSGIEMKRKVHKSWIISRLRFHDGTKFLTMENSIESVLNDDDYSFPFS